MLTPPSIHLRRVRSSFAAIDYEIFAIPALNEKAQEPHTRAIPKKWLNVHV
jgi:hypothetical protein